MEGKQFSTSRSVVIYVRDVLERYGPDALRYYLAAAGPETSDTDFTWEQFVTRNNTELVAGWGNLVNRTLSMVEKNVGSIPGPGELLGPDQEALAASRAAFGPVGALLERSQQKAALAEVMKTVAEANKYLSDQAPWKLKDDPARRDTVLHTALQLVDDAKTLLTPFLPHSSEQVHRMLGGEGPGAASRSCARSTTSTADRATRSSWASTTPRRSGSAGPCGSGTRSTSRCRCSPSSTRPSSTTSWPGSLPPRSRGREQAAPQRRPDDTPPPAPEPLAVEVLDSHCHLDLMAGVRDGGEVPAGRVEAALAAARAVGIGTVVQVGVDLPSSRWAVQAAAAWPQVHAAVALHPNEAGAGAATDEVLREVEQLAGLPQVVAVGETGLDHYRTVGEDGHRRQEESFRAHIAIAKRTGTALVIHDRDAHDDVVRVLLDEGAPDRVVFHCFSGGVELARTCAEHGWVASFAGTLTFANAGGLREAAAVLPPELLLVETDAPFLAPSPHRGRPNGPYLVPLTVRALAQVRGDDVDALCATLMANGRRVFALPA